MSDTDFDVEEFLAGGTADTGDIRSAIAGEMPTIKDPEDPVITLPRGVHADGKWNTKCSVRELTGKDEEYLARKRDVLDYFDAVLALGVEHVGDIDLADKTVSEREEVLSQLLAGERELLFLAVIRGTFGNERDISSTCGSCRKDFTTTLLLDTDFVLTDTLGINPPLTYELTTSKGETLEYRLVNGSDQRAAADGSTTAEQNTIILSRTIKKVNGKRQFDMRDYVLSMSMKDRRQIMEAMEELHPTINNELELECPSCGVKNTVLVNWGDLFRP